MAEAKIMVMLSWISNTLLGVAPFVLEKWQTIILFVVVIVLHCTNFYFKFRIKQLDIEEKEMELRKRQKEIDDEVEE